MALEDLTGTKYIDSLNSSNPAAGDNVSEGDDHIRGIKNVLKTTFPSLDGAVTSTDAELNLLDGVTATTTELNLLDGVTATTTELNYVDGVTSSIQTQLGTVSTTANAALPKAGGAMTGAITTNSTFDGRDVATDGTKLDTVETNADVTDTTNVTSAGALMDSECSSLASVKAINQGLTSTSSPTFTTLNATTVDLGNWTVTESGGVLYFATSGTNKMKVDASGNLTVVGNVTAYGSV